MYVLHYYFLIYNFKGKKGGFRTSSLCATSNLRVKRSRGFLSHVNAFLVVIRILYLNAKLHSVELWRYRVVSLVYPDKLLRQGECTSVKNYRTKQWPDGGNMAKVAEECCHFQFNIIYIVLSDSILFREHHHAARSLWFAPVMTIKTSASLRYKECCILYCVPNYS